MYHSLVTDKHIRETVHTLFVEEMPLPQFVQETQPKFVQETQPLTLEHTPSKKVILPLKKRGGHMEIRTARKTIGERTGPPVQHTSKKPRGKKPPPGKPTTRATTRASNATALCKQDGVEEEESRTIAQMLPAKEMMPHLLSTVSEEWPIYDKLVRSGEYMVFPNLLVYVRTSRHVGTGLGVYVHSFVPEGTTIPVPGRIVDSSNNSANAIQLPEWGGDYAWEIASNVAVGKINDFKGFKTHDEADRQRLHLKKNSIFKFDHHGLLWLEITKDVEAKTELITDYGRNHFSAAMNKMHSRWFRE